MDEMYDKMRQNKPTTTFETAFLAMQRELPIVPKSRDGYNFKYAPYEEFVRVAFPIVHKHGFSFRHRSIKICEDWVVETKLIFAKTGEYDSSFKKYDPNCPDQACGKSWTYGKRYNTSLLLGISIDGEPDPDDAAPHKAAAPAGDDF